MFWKLHNYKNHEQKKYFIKSSKKKNKTQSTLCTQDLLVGGY